MNEQALVAAIAAVWEMLIARAEDRHAFEDELLRALRALESDPLNAAKMNDVLAAVNKAPGGYDLIVDQGSSEAPTLTKGAGRITGAVRAARYVRVPVYYATDRERNVNAYTAERGKLEYGCVNVSVPDDRKMGALPKAHLWRLEFRPDPEKHVIVLAPTPLSLDAWKTEAQSAEALVFIHGYKVTFEDGARRAAQFAVDLNFAGTAMLYSWPSEGNTVRYAVDEGNTIWTVDDFEDFLKVLLAETGFSRVHIVAHSMGSRVLTEGLRRFDPGTLPARSAELVETVFAAPDLDAAVFAKFAALFHNRARRMTLYASSHDKALCVSQTIHKYPRAGDTSDGMLIVDGIDSIDASAVDTSFLGHSFFGDCKSVISDIFYLVRGAKADGERHALESAVAPDGGKYWVMRA